MLFDCSAGPGKAAPPSGANGVFRKNLGQCFGELFIKFCNVPVTSHVFIAFPEAQTRHYIGFDSKLNDSERV